MPRGFTAAFSLARDLGSDCAKDVNGHVGKSSASKIARIVFMGDAD